MCCIGQPPYIHSCDIVNKYCGLKLGTASKLPVHTQLSVDQSSYNLLCGISCKGRLHSRRSPTRIIFPILWTENVHHPVITEKATEQFFFHSLCPRCWSRVCNSFSRYFLTHRETRKISKPPPTLRPKPTVHDRPVINLWVVSQLLNQVLHGLAELRAAWPEDL